MKSGFPASFTLVPAAKAREPWTSRNEANPNPPGAWKSSCHRSAPAVSRAARALDDPSSAPTSAAAIAARRRHPRRSLMTPSRRRLAWRELGRHGENLKPSAARGKT